MEINLDDYRNLVRKEMLKLGANNAELSLIKDETLKNGIEQNRKPEDVAWAILQ